MELARIAVSALSTELKAAILPLLTHQGLVQFLAEGKSSQLSMAQRRSLALWVCTEGGVLLGFLAVVGRPPEARLLDIAVVEAHRGEDIALALLTAMQQAYAGAGYGSLRATLSDGAVAAAALLTKAGWTPPRRTILRCDFHVPSFSAPWLKDYPLPKGYELFFWRDLSDSEWQRLHYLQEQLSFPLSVTPFATRYALEPLNSLGLRSAAGEVDGWMLTHRLDIATVRYSALFVRPALRPLGCPLLLLSNAIFLQKAHPEIPHALCEVNILQSSPSWVRFVERRLAPYASKVSYFLTSSLQLKNNLI